MAEHFEVIGHDLDLEDVEGADVLGADVLGYSGPMEDELEGIYGAAAPTPQQMRALAMANRRAMMARRGQANVRVQRPAWRDKQLAPGVIAPDQGLLPLPLNGSTGTNTFTAALNTITFEGQLQKPFRGERLLVSTIRTGASAVGRLIGQLFVGTDLQQLDVAGFDIEQVGAVTAFGVRLTMKPAQPGVFIRIVTTLNAALAGADTIVATVSLLGRNVH